MDIVKSAVAGTMESSDVYVEIRPAEGLAIELESVVKEQFGDAIHAAAMDVLTEYKIENAALRIIDRGALECVLRARVETAILRGKGET